MTVAMFSVPAFAIAHKTNFNLA